MANEMVASENKDVKIRGSSAAKVKSRQAMHALLSRDEEYVNMPDHVVISAELEAKVDAEVEKETRLTGTKNVMKLVYYDVQGYGLDGIAKLMELSREDVQEIRRSEAYKAARDAVMTEIIALSRRMIEVTTLKAVKTLTECMDSKNDKVKLSAAVEVLNRTGLTATQKIELTTTQNTMMNFTEDELAEIIRGSAAIPADAEVIVNGE